MSDSPTAQAGDRVAPPKEADQLPPEREVRPPVTYRIWRLFYRFGLLVAFVVLIVMFSLLRPQEFATTQNLKAILTSYASLTLIAIGLMLPLIAQRFDLSAAYMATLAGLLAVGLQSFNNWPVWASIVVALAICGCVGLINGLLIALGKLNSLVVTLGAGSILFGAAELYSSGTTIFSGISPQFFKIGQNSVLGIPLPVIYAAIAALVVWYVLQFRPSGRHLYAIGGSEEGARLVGVRVERLIIISFVFSALFAAAGGIVEASRVGSANPTDLQYTLLPAFTAVFLSATVFRPGQYNVWGTVLAVYFVGTGETGMYILGAPSFYAQVFDGAVLLVAIALAEVTRRTIQRLS